MTIGDSNRCARHGFLVDGKTRLPSDPTEIDVEYLPVIGCSRLRCERCGVSVRSEVGVSFAWPPSDLSELYRTDDLLAFPFVAKTTPSCRLYFCRCSSFTETDSHPLWDPDPIPERDPTVPWRCAGHPPLTLPCEVDGVFLGSEDELGAISERVFAGWIPPGAREADTERVTWLRRLYARLGPSSRRVLVRVALSSSISKDADEQGRALIFFKNVRDQAALDELWSLFEIDPRAFAGIPDRISSISGETLEDSLRRAVTSASPPEPPRSEAPPPPKPTRKLYLKDPAQLAVHEGRMLLVMEIASYFASGSVDFARATADDLDGMGVPKHPYLIFDEPLTDEDVKRYRNGGWDSPHEFWAAHQPERPEIVPEPEGEPEPRAAQGFSLADQVGNLNRHQTACLRRVCMNALLHAKKPLDLQGIDDPVELLARTLQADPSLEEDLRAVALRLSVPEPVAPSRDLLATTWRLGPKHWKLEAKTLHGFTSGPGAHSLAKTEEHFECFELSANVKLSHAACYLGFRLAEYTGYLVWLGGRHTGALHDVDGRRNPLIGGVPQPRLLFADEAWNGCFVRADGPRVRVWLNGVKVADLTDPKGSPRGAIGFEVRTTDKQVAHAWIENVRLSELEPGS